MFKINLNGTSPKVCWHDCISSTLLLRYDDIIVVALVFVVFCYFMHRNLFLFSFFFSLSLWIWHCLFFIVHFFLFLVDSFDGFRPLLVASQCQIGSLPNKLSLFVRSLRPCHFHRARPHNIVSSWERTSLVARPHEEVSRWDRKTLVEQHCQRWANWGRRRPFAAGHSHTQRQLAVLSG